MYFSWKRSHTNVCQKCAETNGSAWLKYSEQCLIWTENTSNVVRITRWFGFSGVQILFELTFFVNFVYFVFEYDRVCTLPVFTLSGVDCIAYEMVHYCPQLCNCRITQPQDKNSRVFPMRSGSSRYAYDQSAVHLQHDQNTVFAVSHLSVVNSLGSVENFADFSQ